MPADKRTRVLLSGTLVALVALIGLLLRSPLGQGLANASYDSLHSLSILGRPPFDDSRVVIVYLDLASFLSEHRDPAERWPRDLHARLLKRLTADGARAVVFDFIFDSPGPSTDADDAFAAAIRANGRVILAAEHNNKISHVSSAEVDGARLTRLTLPLDKFAQAAAGWGVASLAVDDDFVVRRRLGRFQTEDAVDLSTAAFKLLEPGVARPVEDRWVRYYGPALTVPHVSYREALSPSDLPAGFFRDKVVLVGPRPIEGLIDERRDEFRSPFHSWVYREYFMPGVEVHAMQTLNLLRGDWLRRLPFEAENGLLFLVALLFGGGLLYVRPVPATVLAAAGAGLTLAGSWAGFAHGFWFPWLIVAAGQIPTALFGAWLYQFQDWYRTRKRLESAKRIADAKILEQAALIDKAHDAILVEDLNGMILYANPSALKLYGWSLAELRQPATRATMASPGAEALQTARDAVLRTGEWNGELLQQDKSGRRLILASRWTLIRDDAHRPSALLLISSDVTEQKALEQQFLRTQRLNTIGMLAGGMAHDLNNALAPVLLGAQLLRRKTQDVEDRNLLSLIEANTNRGADMVRQVLLFARGRGGEFERLDLAPILKDLEKMVRETFPKNIQVEKYLPADLWPVQGNPTQLHQVLLNLCVNARDAMPAGGKLSFVADNLALSPTEATKVTGASAGDFVSILVSDTGTGMPPEILAKVFEPFFTTKGEGVGTGIGLSTVRRIVDAHQGFVRIESTPGEGTAFEVCLPRALEAAPLTTGSAVESPRGDGEWILVVEDEHAIRDLISDGLVAYGYRVLAAETGEEAVRLFEQEPQKIRLLLTDHAMSGMDGTAVVTAIRRMAPGLPYVLASATEDEVAKAATAVLRKPFSLDELLTTVHRALHPPVAPTSESAVSRAC